MVWKHDRRNKEHVSVAADALKGVAQILTERWGRNFEANVAEISFRIGDGVSQKRFLEFGGLLAHPVNMTNKWGVHDHGHLIAFDKKTGQPYAIITEKEGSTFAWAADKSKKPLTHEFSRRLANKALSVHRQFTPSDLKTIGSLWRFLIRGKRHSFIFSILLALITSLIGAIIPILVGHLTDDVMLNAKTEELSVFLFLMVALNIAVAAARAALEMLLSRSRGAITQDFQIATIHKMLAMELDSARKLSGGDVAHRVTAMNSLSTVLNDALVKVPFNLLSFLLLFGVMLYFDLYFALVFLAVATLISLISIFLFVNEAKHHNQTLSLSGAGLNSTSRYLQGIAVLRAFRAERRVAPVVASTMARLSIAQFRMRFSNLLFQAVSTAVPSLIMLSLVGYMLLSSDPIVVSELIVFSLILQQISSAHFSLLESVRALLLARNFYDRIKPFLVAPTESKLNGGVWLSDISGSFELSNVSLLANSSQRVPILKDLTLNISAGQFIGICGPSGSGKSSLLNLLMGFQHPSSGLVKLDGVNMNSLNLISIRDSMGAVLSSNQLVDDTILKNLADSRNFDAQHVWQILEQVGLGDFIRSLPMRLNTHISANGVCFSGGEKQRLLIARALVKKPKILIMDEPTSAVDEQNQRLITDILKELDCTRIVVAHRLSTLIDADRIFVLNEGRLEQSGTYPELAQLEGVFKSLICTHTGSDQEGANQTINIRSQKQVMGH